MRPPRGSSAERPRVSSGARATDARHGVRAATRVVSRGRLPTTGSQAGERVARVPVLADGADPGKTTPSPMAIRDRVLIDAQLVGDHHPDQLFAYDVTRDNLEFLRGLACPGDRIVFRRGGRVTPDRICAVRTHRGVILARVEFREHSIVLLPGKGVPGAAPLELENTTGLRGVVAGTHVLLIRR